MSTTLPPNVQPDNLVDTENSVHPLNPKTPGFDFSIGGRVYWITRDSNRVGFKIVCRGDLVEFVSSLHFGEVGALRRITHRLAEIEKDATQP